MIDVPKGTKITLYKEGHFDAAHRLNNYEGKCANMHGHRWVYRVYVSADQLDDCGMVIDFKDLKKAMKDLVEDKFDHKVINDNITFNPTAENLAIYIFLNLSSVIDAKNIQVVRVDVFESPESCATITIDDVGGSQNYIHSLEEDVERLRKIVKSNRCERLHGII